MSEHVKKIFIHLVEFGVESAISTWKRMQDKARVIHSAMRGIT